MELMVEAEALVKRFGPVRALAGIDLAVRGVRLPWCWESIVSPTRDDRQPGRNETACGVVSLRRHCPDQVPGGRRPASELSPASQPFLPAPGPPALVRSSSLDHLADTIHVCMAPMTGA